mmetsp:Transcript_9706/g.18511  ORF Transcript_9706/g.18511 Transcript_9706/m.18511 type:complete len:695 (+) Transcript_9706:61-2145(+)
MRRRFEVPLAGNDFPPNEMEVKQQKGTSCFALVLAFAVAVVLVALLPTEYQHVTTQTDVQSGQVETTLSPHHSRLGQQSELLAKLVSQEEEQQQARLQAALIQARADAARTEGSQSQDDQFPGARQKQAYQRHQRSHQHSNNGSGAQRRTALVYGNHLQLTAAKQELQLQRRVRIESGKAVLAEQSKRDFGYIRELQLPINCDVTLQDRRFEDGSMWRVNCPFCDRVHFPFRSAPVYGVGVFTDHSAICFAAQLEGLLSADGGVVQLERRPSQSYYPGLKSGLSRAFSGGVETSEVRSAEASEGVETSEGLRKGLTAPQHSFRFHSDTGNQSDEEVVLRCQDTLQNFRWPVFSRRTVRCPADCDLPNIRVLGTTTYHELTPICGAALHSAVLPIGGGSFQVFLLPGQRGGFVGTVSGLVLSEDFAGNSRKIFSVAPASVLIPCDLKGDSQLLFFKGGDNQYRWQHLRCGHNCNLEAGVAAVYGGEQRYYGRQSSVCRAAIHAGLVSSQGGVFLFSHVVNDGVSLAASEAHTIWSESLPAGHPQFHLMRLQSLVLDCETTGHSALFARQTTWRVVCPAGCQLNVHNHIFVEGGGEINRRMYGAASSVCLAAAHQGQFRREQGGDAALMVNLGSAHSFGDLPFARPIATEGAFAHLLDQAGSLTSLAGVMANGIQSEPAIVEGSLFTFLPPNSFRF